MNFKSILPILSVFSLFFCAPQFAMSAIPKKNQNIQSFRGGQAGIGFSLLNVKAIQSKTETKEQIQIQMGNLALQKLEGTVGYYNVQNDLKNKRVVIDFYQTLNSQFEARELQKVVKNLKLVKNSDLLFEPQSQTMSLVFQTTKPVDIKVLSRKGNKSNPATVAVTLTERKLRK